MEFNLNKREIKKILDDLLCDLSSLYSPQSYKNRMFKDFDNDNYKEILKYPYSCFGCDDMSKGEFNLIMSLIKKLTEQKLCVKRSNSE